MIECPGCEIQTKGNLLRQDSQNNFSIYQCTSCNAIYSNIFENEINIEENIQLNLSKNHKSAKFRLNRSLYYTTALWDIQYLESHIDLAKIKNSLDIGTQFGFLVRELTTRGIKATGLEKIKFRDSVSDNIIYEKFDLNFNESKKYDLISLTNMIHYFPNSYEILKKCLRMLNPKGILFVTSYSPESSLIREFTKRRSVGPLVYLSRKNYENFCVENNLQLLDYRTFYSKLFLSKINKKEKMKIFVRYILYKIGISQSFIESKDGERNYILIKRN